MSQRHRPMSLSVAHAAVNKALDYPSKFPNNTRMPTPTITHVFFDVGGVLVNLDPVGFDAKLRAHCAPGTGRLFPDAFLKEMGAAVRDYHCGQIIDQKFLQMAYDFLKTKHGCSLNVDELRTSWEEDFIPSANPETIALIPALKAKGIDVGIISDTNSLHYSYIQRRFPAVFQDIPENRHFLSCLIGTRKADGPKIFEMVLSEVFGYAPKSFPTREEKAGCLMIDNDTNALKTAAQFGMETLLVVPGMDWQKELSRFGIGL